MLTTKQTAFLEESNRIEGEEWFELPTEAMEFALDLVRRSIRPGDIEKLHELHRKPFTNFHGGREPIHFGRWRNIHVRVGRWTAPHPVEVGGLIAGYCADWKNMNAWEAHVRFEKIHPFEDLNGRVGRLLWLIKALEEGYDYSLSFLQTFYYQTLKRGV